MKYDFIVVGAGISGITISERLASKGNKILLVEASSDIGGACADGFYEGIKVHFHGPHIFHTSNKKVWNYLSQFTEWNDYKHRVKCFIDGKFVTLPFNLNSLFELFPEKIAMVYAEELSNQYEYGKQISIFNLKESNNKVINNLGNYIYKNIYQNYSRKQWGMSPEKLDKNILKRVMIRISNNDDYFLDKYQGIPKNGYSEMLYYMTRNKNITVLLNRKIDLQTMVSWTSKKTQNTKVIYTGRIDELFSYCYGELPYRTLKFKYSIYNWEYITNYSVINYPQRISMTRMTEYKNITKQKCFNTLESREFPKKCNKDDIPYYPILTENNIKLYNKYKFLVNTHKNLYVLGRLAEYKYYDMDDAVARAMGVADELG